MRFGVICFAFLFAVCFLGERVFAQQVESVMGRVAVWGHLPITAVSEANGEGPTVIVTSSGTANVRKFQPEWGEFVRATGFIHLHMFVDWHAPGGTVAATATGGPHSIGFSTHASTGQDYVVDQMSWAPPNPVGYGWNTISHKFEVAATADLGNYARMTGVWNPGSWYVFYHFYSNNPWTGDGTNPANWNDASHWAGGTIPNASDALAHFGPNSTNHIRVNAPVSVGAILMEDSTTLQVWGSYNNIMTLQSDTAAGITLNNGYGFITAPVRFAANTDVVTLEGTTLYVDAPISSVTFGPNQDVPEIVKGGQGHLVIDGTQDYVSGTRLVLGEGTTTFSSDVGMPNDRRVDLVSYAATNFRVSQHLESLSIVDGTLSLGPDSGLIIETDELYVAEMATLDLGKNRLVVTNADVEEVAALIYSGWNGGDWLGTGITSSIAQADPSKYAVGWSPLGQGVLVRVTASGDANLDGIVDGEDYLIWQSNSGMQSGAHWYQGDFNFDGRVDGDDYLIWQANWGQTAPTPEPSAGVVLFIIGGILLGRRRCA